MKTARQELTQVVTMYVDLWIAATEAQREQLPYQQFDIPTHKDTLKQEIDDLCGLTDGGKTIAVFRFVDGECLVEWMRSYQDFATMRELVNDYSRSVSEVV